MPKDKKPEEEVDEWDKPENKKFKDSELRPLPAVGDDVEILKKLDMVGVHTFEALAVIPEDELTNDAKHGGAGLTEIKAVHLVEQAQNKCGLKPEMIQGKDMDKYEYISTGSKELDKVLRGGYMLRETVEIGGHYGMGKTNMCMTAAVMAYQQYKAPTIYIHTEIHQPFKKERMQEIADAREVTGYNVDEQLYYVKALRSDEQVYWVRNADREIKRTGAKLLVVDSIGGHLRYEYVGQGRLARRQQILGPHLRQMSRLSQVFNVSIIMTNQVHADPTGASQVLTMGNIMHTNVGKILQVFNANAEGKRSQYTKSAVSDEGYREVRVVKAVDIEETGVLCRITQRGWDDAVKTPKKPKPKPGEEEEGEDGKQAADT